MRVQGFAVQFFTVATVVSFVSLAAPRAAPTCTAVVNATIIDPERETARRATVVACGDQFTSIGAAADAQLRQAAHVIDGRGAFLVPGLWDMHVHLDQAAVSAGPLLVSHGVTSVRDVGSPFSFIAKWTERAAAGAVVMPRIYPAGIMFESPRFMQLVDRLGRTLPPEEATLLSDVMRRRVAVANAVEFDRELATAETHGATFVKIRNVETPELLYAFAARAKRAGLPVAAHVLPGVDLARASESGVRSFEHYEGFAANDVESADPARSVAIAMVFRKNRTALVPTLVTRESQRQSPAAASRVLTDQRRLSAMRRAGVAPDVLDLWRMKVDLMRVDPTSDWSHTWDIGVRFARHAYQSGVDILAGTDLGAPFVYPGDSLVKELEMLTEYVGLTPGQALTAATVGPARWFGRDTVVGTIEVGKAADMVLLGSNPLIRTRNLRDVLGVMLRGTYYSRAELRRRGTADN